MKVLQVNNKFIGAGAENVMKTLGDGLSEKGHEIYYATYENISNKRVFKIHILPSELMRLVNIFEISRPNKKSSENFILNDPNDSLIKRIGINFRSLIPFADPIAKKSMQSIINNVKPDIIHCHNILPSLAPIIIAKKNNIPVVVTLHGHWLTCPLANRIQLKSKHICESTDFEKCNINCASSCVNVEKYMEQLQNIIKNNVDCLVPVSNYVENLLENYGYPKDRLMTIHNGIDVDKFKANNSSIKPQVIHAGRLSRHKGSHIFLKVAEKLNQDYPEIKFLLVGSGLKKRMAAHSNIEYLGWISDSQLVKVYSESLCVVIPSQWPEPHPLITLEAMACSTPVIGTNIAGIAETIIPNSTGFLIDQLDEEMQIKLITEKIVDLYKNTNIREKMGKSSRNHIVNQFDKKRMVNRYIDLYNNLL